MNGAPVVAPLVLGGRRFRPVAQGSVEHDVWLMGRVRLSGLPEIPRAENETPEDWASRLLAAVLASGALLELLGGLLVPEATPDEAWSPTLARETAAFIGALREPEDKLVVQSLALSVLLPFLQSELASSRRSDASSPRVPGDASSDTTSGPATTSGSGDR